MSVNNYLVHYKPHIVSYVMNFNLAQLSLWTLENCGLFTIEQ